MLWDYRLERKFSAVGFCSGAISGLVAITPASVRFPRSGKTTRLRVEIDIRAHILLLSLSLL